MEGATFTVTAADLWRTIGNAAVAASKDDTLPVLTYIQVTIGEPDDNAESALVAAATDRYMLMSDTCKLTGVTEAFTFLLSSTDWKTLDRLLKQWTRHTSYVWATVENGAVKWNMPDGSGAITRMQDGDFPKWRTLLPDPTTSAKLDAPIAFSPKFLARLDKLRGQGTSPARFLCTSPSKIVRIDVGDTVTGAIMPVRLAGGV